MSHEGIVDFQHYVLTRFGLGQMKEDFFQTNIEYLENTLYSSLVSQSNKDFTWLLMIDVRAPKWVFRRLDGLMAGLPSADYVIHDPFEELNIVPDIKDTLGNYGVRSGDYVVTTRVDSDDALCTDYVDRVNRRVGEVLNKCGRAPLSINPVDGVYFYSSTGDFVSVYKDNYSVQTVGSVFGSCFLHAHSGSHKKISSTFENKGWHALYFNTGRPMWMRSIRKDSNTRKGRKVDWLESNWIFVKRLRQLVNRLLGKQIATYFIRKMKPCDLYDVFGFSAESRETLGLVEREMVIRDKVVSGNGLPARRWQYKRAILNQYIELLNEHGVSGYDIQNKREELVSRYYAK